MAVFIPTAAKIAHVLENEKHEICEGGYLNHYHESDLDCEFEKFNLNKVYQSELLSLNIVEHNFPKQNITSYSELVYDGSWNTHTTRGPPVMI